MTLIALIQNSSGFECYADSLVSFKQGLGLKTYCKVLVLPVRYRTTRNGKTTTKDYKFGMAIAGNLAAATSVYSVLSGAAQSLHSHDTTKPPKVNDFVNLALRIARHVYEDMRPLADDGRFGFFLFGHSIETGTPFAVKFSTELTDSGIYDIVPRRCNIGVDQVSLLGSGSVAFEQEMKDTAGKGIPFCDLFYNFIRSGKIQSVGGLPQLLIAVENGVSIEPVLIGEDDGSNATTYHSGMNMDGYKTVGDYMVGLHLNGINMEPFERCQALKAQGYDPSDGSISVGETNQAVLDMQLKRNKNPDFKLFHRGVLSVASPRHSSSGLYAGFACPKCGKFNGIFKSSRIRGRNPFPDGLSFSIACAKCNNTFHSQPSEHTVK